MVDQRLNSQHLDQMVRLISEGFPSSQWSKDGLEKLLNLETCVAWGAFHEDILVGFILIQKVLDESEILLIVVHLCHRRKGVARLLMEKIFSYLKHEQIQRIFLEVSVENEPALSFYRNFDFEITGIRKNYYSHKTNKSAHIMQKNI
ncbi:MAG: GNAT family N-acetyltransferase [Alphaproteobacteria bacterium]